MKEAICKKITLCCGILTPLAATHAAQPDYRHRNLHGSDHRNCGNHDKTGTEATNNAPGPIQNEEANLLTTDSSSQNASSGTSYDLSKIADGTYTGKASVAENGDAENEDEFAGYDVSVEVAVSRPQDHLRQRLNGRSALRKQDLSE